MLKLVSPIELNIRKVFTEAGEGFSNRILSNYSMIQPDVHTEDLLHVTTQPPEYYFGEDSAYYYNTDTKVSVSRETTTNIINNLVNRIMVEPNVGLMYQDRVYISNALKKLGIRDEKTFMKQVYNLKDEIANTNRLIDLYFTYGDEIASSMEEVSTNIDRSKTYIEETNAGDIHLHEDIFNRLKSALIYSIVNNYQENAYGADVISTNEMMIAQQRRTYENILLRTLENNNLDKPLPLIFRAENFYEEYDFEGDELTDSHISNVIDAATLLNYVVNAIETKSTANNSNINTWYEIRPQISSVSESTLLRMESNLRNEGSVSYIQNLQETELSQMELTLQNEEITNLEQSQINLEQNLKQETRQNLESHNRYQEIVQNEMERVQRQLSDDERRQRQRQDSIRALDAPEELIETLRMEQQVSDDNRQAIEEMAAREALSDQEQVINQIQQFMANPQAGGIPGAIIREDDFSTLAGDIMMVERENAELTHRMEERNETIERVSQEIQRELEGETIVSKNRREARERVDQITLTHRTTESIDIDELREELRAENRRNTTTRETNVTENRTETVHTNTLLNEQVIDTKQINRDIEQAVNDSVNQRVSLLSDQIYRRIESKLELEKRRRGL